MADKLRVQVGDVIRQGTGDYSTTVLIAWTNRSYVPGATDATATEHERPSEKAHPVDAICLVAPVGDGQFMGIAMDPHFMTYLGWLRFTEEETDAADEADDAHTAREGHTWEINASGYAHVTTPWWEKFRGQSAEHRAWDEGYEVGVDDTHRRLAPPGPNGPVDPTPNPYL